MNGRWKGLAVGPFRGYLGIVGIVKTNPEPVALANEGSPTEKTFELRLQEMRLRYEEEVARLRHRQARRMTEQRLKVRMEERLRRRPKQLADRLARQARHEIAVKMHVKIMWNQYRSRVNGMVRSLLLDDNVMLISFRRPVDRSRRLSPHGVRLASAVPSCLARRRLRDAPVSMSRPWHTLQAHPRARGCSSARGSHGTARSTLRQQVASV